MFEEKKTHPEHKYSVTFVPKVGTISLAIDLPFLIIQKNASGAFMLSTGAEFYILQFSHLCLTDAILRTIGSKKV